jgi:hypothetical protein
MSDDNNPNPAPTTPEPPANAAPPAPAPAAPAQPSPEPPKTIAAGGEPEAPKEPEHKPTWGEDWRAKFAEHVAAGDKKAAEREMKRLERIADPAAVYGMYRELEAKFSQGGLTKIPSKDASPEDVKAFHKALGVPEDPKEYVEKLSLPNGVTLGDRDKVIASEFAQAMHGAGLTQGQMDKAYSWYLQNQEAQAAAIDQQDDHNRLQGQQALKEEWGPSYNRNINAISSLFAYAPGGANLDNDGALFNRLLGGRMADGKIIGDDPEMVKFLVSLAKEVNPIATVVENHNSGKSIEDELREISNLRRTDRRAYNKDEKIQARERELLAALEKHRARA